MTTVSTPATSFDRPVAEKRWLPSLVGASVNLIPFASASSLDNPHSSPNGAAATAGAVGVDSTAWGGSAARAIVGWAVPSAKPATTAKQFMLLSRRSQGIFVSDDGTGRPLGGRFA